MVPAARPDSEAMVACGGAGARCGLAWLVFLLRLRALQAQPDLVVATNVEVTAISAVMVALMTQVLNLGGFGWFWCGFGRIFTT